MKTYFKGILLLVVSLSMIILSGCDQGVKEEDLAEALKGRDAAAIVELIDSYKEQKNKDELDEVVVKDFEETAESGDYEDFKYMEGLAEDVKDEDLKEDLEKVLSDNAANKVKSYIIGKWVRKDYTNLDGAVAEVKWSGEKGTAILTGVSKTKNNTYGFQKGDVKWKNIEALSDTEFVFEDLHKSSDDSGYYQAYATVDYENGMILCKISSEKKDYENGNTQVWVKQELVDEKKEILKEKDFKFNKEITDEGIDHDSFWYYYYNAKIKNDRKVDLRGKIKFKSTRNAVLKKYGYGHIMFQSYKKDPFYIANKQASDDTGRLFCTALEKSKYAVMYTDKKDDRFIKMYFSKKNRIIAVVTAHDYENWKKEFN